MNTQNDLFNEPQLRPMLEMCVGLIFQSYLSTSDHEFIIQGSNTTTASTILGKQKKKQIQMSLTIDTQRCYEKKHGGIFKDIKIYSTYLLILVYIR